MRISLKSEISYNSFGLKITVKVCQTRLPAWFFNAKAEFSENDFSNFSVLYLSIEKFPFVLPEKLFTDKMFSPLNLFPDFEFV